MKKYEIIKELINSKERILKKYKLLRRKYRKSYLININFSRKFQSSQLTHFDQAKNSKDVYTS